MRKIIALLAIACTVGMTSCKKEFQRYEGPTQIRFEKTSYSLNVTTTPASVTIPVQLVSTEKQPEIVANIAVNDKSTATAATTVPTAVKIDAGRFVSDLVISCNYADLKAETLAFDAGAGAFSIKGNANTLIVDLTAPVKVAPNFNQATVKLTTVQAAIKSDFTVKVESTDKSLNVKDVLAIYPATAFSTATTYTLKVNAEETTCAAAVTVPATAQIAADATKGSIAIPVDYAALADETWTADKDGNLTVLSGNKNILVLDVVSTAGGARLSNLTKIKIKVVKQQPKASV